MHRSAAGSGTFGVIVGLLAPRPRFQATEKGLGLLQRQRQIGDCGGDEAQGEPTADSCRPERLRASRTREISVFATCGVAVGRESINVCVPDKAGNAPAVAAATATAAAAAKVTTLLNEAGAGDPQAAAELLPLVYEQLRALAGRKMRQERPDQTLQATALVHEAYLRLVDTTQGAAVGQPVALLRRRGGVDAAHPRRQRPPPRAAQARRRAAIASTWTTLELTRRRPAGRAARAGRGADRARRGAPGEGAAREPPLLRRPDARGGGAGAGHLHLDRRPPLGVRPGLALPPHGRRTRRPARP